MVLETQQFARSIERMQNPFWSQRTNDLEAAMKAAGIEEDQPMMRLAKTTLMAFAGLVVQLSLVDPSMEGAAVEKGQAWQDALTLCSPNAAEAERANVSGVHDALYSRLQIMARQNAEARRIFLGLVTQDLERAWPGIASRPKGSGTGLRYDYVKAASHVPMNWAA